MHMLKKNLQGSRILILSICLCSPPPLNLPCLNAFQCISNDKLFQFEYESSSWINIPLPSLQDPEVATIRKVKSLFAENGNILITLHWSGAEIRGYDDERPYVYEDKTFALSYLQQLVKK